MRTSSLAPVALLLLLGTALSFPVQEDPPLVLDADLHHLGNDATPDWTEAAREPEGARLELAFDWKDAGSEATLGLVQRDVNDPWFLRLNGREIGRLETGAASVERFYPVPPNVLVAGENRLVIESAAGTDDVILGKVRLWRGSFREVFDLRVVEVRVFDESGGAPLPARIAVTDLEDGAVPLYYGERLHTAVREGLTYTADGLARFELPPGAYRLHVSRGMEWSLARSVLVVSEPLHQARITLRREVDTRGFVACDTHIHTLTFSGHGDSSVEERLVTLAGEGVELAIATDHNHNTDYRPLQAEMALSPYFTAVVGNEVTTPVGHFNAFPLKPGDTIPPHELHDFAAIVAGCRERGARAVILNHPRWPDHQRGPYGVGGLDTYTGATEASPIAHDYDAVELINSDTEEPQPMQLFRDWFALMNRGETLVGVASSDSHAVGVVVGQGRTYVTSATDDPSTLDVEACADSVAAGRSSMAMGIFTNLTHRGRSVMGATLGQAALDGDAEPLELRIASPGWVRPETLTVYANGIAVYERSLVTVEDRPTDLRIPLPYRPGGRDAWLVCVVRGADAGGPHWPQRNAYTLGVTNPVYVDGDGDGTYRRPRELAQRLLEETGAEEATVRARLADLDTPTAIHLMDLVREEWMRRAGARALELGREVAAEHDPSLAEWLETRAD